jgi:DNA invertase Pin-like site-specific DNA recombinase
MDVPKNVLEAARSAKRGKPGTPGHIMAMYILAIAQDSIDKGGRKSKLTPEDDIKLAEMKAKGIPVNHLAAMFGVSDQTIYNHLKG